MHHGNDEMDEKHGDPDDDVAPVAVDWKARLSGAGLSKEELRVVSTMRHMMI